MTREELLAPVKRWMRKRRDAVVEGVYAGTISTIDIKERHKVELDEFIQWRTDYERRHKRLKVTGRRAA